MQMHTHAHCTRSNRGERDQLKFPIIPLAADWILTLSGSRPGAGRLELPHITVYSALQPPADCNLSSTRACVRGLCALGRGFTTPVSTPRVDGCITHTGGWGGGGADFKIHKTLFISVSLLSEHFPKGNECDALSQ